MKPIVYMLLGLPLSGKTTYSLELQRKTGFKRFALDEEYFKVVGNKQNEHRDFEIENQIVDKLRDETSKLLKEGKSVILDYCPWTKSDREEFKKFIEDQGSECKIVYFDVPLDELKRRAEGRNKLQDQNLQYITPSMLDDFVKRFEKPEAEVVEVIN